MDSPGLRLKHRAARVDGGYVVAPVEVYGSPILATWVDRDLTIAGTLVVRDERSGAVWSGYSVVPFRLCDPCAVIPNLAVHLNRKMNEQLSYNEHEHLNVLLDLAGAHSADYRQVNDTPAARLVAAAAAGVKTGVKSGGALPT